MNQTSYPELVKQIDCAEVELKKAQEKVKKAKNGLENAMKQGSNVA